MIVRSNTKTHAEYTTKLFDWKEWTVRTDVEEKKKRRKSKLQYAGEVTKRTFSFVHPTESQIKKNPFFSKKPYPYVVKIGKATFEFVKKKEKNGRMIIYNNEFIQITKITMAGQRCVHKKR